MPTAAKPWRWTGWASRQRAELLVIRRLIDEGELPLFLHMVPEPRAPPPLWITLRQRCPQLRCSEYLPDPQHRLRGQVPNRDLRSLGVCAGSTVSCSAMRCWSTWKSCNLPWRPWPPPCLGGYLLATVPLAYGSQDSIIKARWRGEDQEPELLMEPGRHGDSVGENSLQPGVSHPGWELGSAQRRLSARRASMRCRLERYGVLGAELPIVFVVVAKR